VFDEYTVEDRTPDGMVLITCTHPSHTQPFVWERPPEHRTRRSGEGLGADLGIWDKLLECFLPGEPRVEYGVVEDRLFERYPAVCEELMRRYGHTWRGSHRPANQFSMAAYLAARLSELADEGHLAKTFGPATGPWRYNGMISYWQVAGGEPEP
jgi:hypothetical protein